MRTDLDSKFYDTVHFDSSVLRSREYSGWTDQQTSAWANRQDDTGSDTGVTLHGTAF